MIEYQSRADSGPSPAAERKTIDPLGLDATVEDFLFESPRSTHFVIIANYLYVLIS